MFKAVLKVTLHVILHYKINTLKELNMKKFTNKCTNKLNNKSTSKSAVSLLLITSLMAAPSYANNHAINEEYQMLSEQEKITQANTNEEIGFGTGAVIGGVLAGPLGAFFAGVLGSFIAKNVNSENSIEDLELSLLNKQQTMDEIIVQHQKAIQATEQSYQSELLSLESNYKQSTQLQAENLLMSLQFSTGSSELQPHYQQQVAALANMLQQSPGLSIDLSGYTDLQGEESLNHALSLARVNSVKNALIGDGVESDRIRIFAFGENEPVVASTEKEISFYDRRVVIKLHQTSDNQTAKNF